jgi:hypothetical protein
MRPIGSFKPAAFMATAASSGHPQTQAVQAYADAHPEYAPPFSPRRSMPEIKPVTLSHFKRNSYQEDRRPTVRKHYEHSARLMLYTIYWGGRKQTNLTSMNIRINAFSVVP